MPTMETAEPQQTDENIKNSEPTQRPRPEVGDDGLLCNERVLSLGMSREVAEEIQKEQEQLENNNTNNPVPRSKAVLYFDSGQVLEAIELDDTEDGETGRGLRVGDTINDMWDLYGKDCIWEYYPYKGRLDICTYEFEGYKLEICIFRADTYTDEASLPAADGVPCGRIMKIAIYKTGSERDSFMLSESGDSVIRFSVSFDQMAPNFFYIDDRKKGLLECSMQKRKNNDGTVSILEEETEEEWLRGKVGKDGHIVRLTTSSPKAVTGRGLVIGDTVSRVEELYGKHYTLEKEKGTGETIITYPLYLIELSFHIKKNQVSRITIKRERVQAQWYEEFQLSPNAMRNVPHFSIFERGSNLMAHDYPDEADQKVNPDGTISIISDGKEWIRGSIGEDGRIEMLTSSYEYANLWYRGYTVAERGEVYIGDSPACVKKVCGKEYELEKGGDDADEIMVYDNYYTVTSFFIKKGKVVRITIQKLRDIDKG